MPEPSGLVAIALATGGAIFAGWAAATRPFLAIGCLFVLASLSRLVVETPVGSMRIEQPAIAVVALVLAARGRFGILRSISRRELAIAAAFGAYLAVLALSSALFAPQRLDSLRLVAWLATSMVGGVVVYILARPDPARSVGPFAFGGAAKAALGFAVAVPYLVLGTTANWGVQEALGILPRVHAFSWEANIYASFLAMSIPFALEAARGRYRTAGMVMLVLVVAGLPLGSTRGANLGAIAGILAYVAVRLARERRIADMPRLGTVAAVALAVGLVAADVLLPNALERYIADLPTPTPSATAPGGPGVPGSGGPGGSAGSPGPVETVAPTPVVTPGPPPSLLPYPDTISYRMDRVPVALNDLRSSPLIGLGAESFGQRHVDPEQVGSPPDHIAILAVAVLYDSGILGAAALAVAFLLLLAGLWTASRPVREDDASPVGPAAAFIGSILALLVTSQATNALHFASNWMVVGAAVALIGASVRRVAGDGDADGS